MACLYAMMIYHYNCFYPPVKDKYGDQDDDSDSTSESEDENAEVLLYMDSFFLRNVVWCIMQEKNLQTNADIVV